ncbi:Gp49 [Mycolicibacterium canariasense]|uniref:Gp49 n=1 Tax=Mycolicibacterium canariasense TaxID=228230 RepID=A0A124E1R1_MYCCR|nr:hypothetical protein [Mycolicibacterium canariasense]MCV7208770.1 hypothetical protein [Mycolicibacterium canariasense]ORV07162.1 hypothetical protein AWB94_14280 [Mycolicibacterium canariasense]GAS94444.1 Gp49 [Mycolicibacterium canariasense]
MLAVLKECWKALLAFLALFLTNVAMQLQQGGVPWPTDGGQWVRFLATVALGTYVVWQGPANKPRPKPRRRRRAPDPGQATPSPIDPK